MSTHDEVKHYLTEDEQADFISALEKSGDLDFVGAAKSAKVDYYTQVLQEIQANLVFKSKLLAYLECLRAQTLNLMYRTATGKARGKGCNGPMCKQVIALIDSGEIFKGGAVTPTKEESRPASVTLPANLKKGLNLSGGDDVEEEDDGF